MAKKTNVSMVIRNLRKVEVLQSQGRTVAQSCKEINVSEQTYYRWRKEYGRLSLDQAILNKKVKLGAYKICRNRLSNVS